METDNRNLPANPEILEHAAVNSTQTLGRRLRNFLTAGTGSWFYFASVVILIWGLSLTLLTFYRNDPSPAALAQNQPTQPTPQVLGEEASIRGDAPQKPQEPPLFVKTNDMDYSSVTAKSFLVYDGNTGQILAKKNKDLRLPIASLTKIITGLVAYDNLDFNALLTVAQSDIFNVSPILHLAIGDQIKINDIFDSMIVGSANDAAMALANHVEKVTGRDFIELMNEKAQVLGMANSKFSNPLGFDSKDNYSTAADLKLAVDASQQLAVFSNLGRRTSFYFSGLSGLGYKIFATDKLLSSHPEIEAVKTGYTENSMGSIIVKVSHQGRKLIFIVLDSVSRERDLEKLEQQIIDSYSLPQ